MPFKFYIILPDVRYILLIILSSESLLLLSVADLCGLITFLTYYSTDCQLFCFLQVINEGLSL